MPPDSSIPASKKYVHLYMPIITALLIVTNPGLFPTSVTDRPQKKMLIIALSALPTYYFASQIYPSNRPDLTPEQDVRFTRKHDAYRALVLFTYGRVFGTPFNLQFLIADFILSYVIGYAIGEPQQKRYSEFAVAMCWTAASAGVMMLLPGNFWVTVADRAIWRASWLALVDDVVAVLERPRVGTLGGNIRLVLTQAGTITFLVWFGLATLMRWSAKPMSDGDGEGA
jgi:hypothetical protein